MSFINSIETIMNILIEIQPDNWEQQCDNIGNAIGILAINKAYPDYPFSHTEIKHAMYITALPTITVNNPIELENTFQVAIEYVKKVNGDINNIEQDKVYLERIDNLYDYTKDCLIQIYNRGKYNEL